jgi:hypothetical protein
MNFNLLTPDCQNALLISDDFCLSKSFEIIENNFDLFSNELNLNDEQYKKYVILKERFENNKDKYRKFLTFVNQFSASLEDIQSTYNFYKDTWEANKTPIELLYPNLISVNLWGSFDEKTGKILENTTTSTFVVNQIKNWINTKYPPNSFYLYKKFVVLLYFQKNIPADFKFSATFKEDCDCQGGTSVVCCSGPANHGGSRGCNKMPVGPRCGNMFILCPAATLVNKNCTVGSCKGWGSGFNAQSWKGKTLSIDRKITSPNNNYFIGFSKITFSLNINTNTWERES